MDTDEKIKERKRHNAPFLAAFAYMMKIQKINQFELAKKIGSNSSLISEYRAGRKRVSEDMMDRLLLLSDGKINRYYLEGVSQYMLIDNVPDDESYESMVKDGNPDYEVMRRQRQTATPGDEHVSSQVNSIIAAKDETIDDLRGRVAFLESQLAEKDKQIAGLIAKIGQPASKRDYPFGIGSAETLEMNK